MSVGDDLAPMPLPASPSVSSSGASSDDGGTAYPYHPTRLVATLQCAGIGCAPLMIDAPCRIRYCIKRSFGPPWSCPANTKRLRTCRPL